MAPYPGGRQILRAAAHADVLTYLGAWTRSQVQRALDGQRADSGWARLAPGVDLDVWQRSPEVIDKSNELRGELRLEGRPVVACVSRLVARKGQDRLISAWPTVLRQFPDAVLLLVGTGSRASQLQGQARDLGDSVRFTGRVPYEDLPAYTALADVCALPARSRLGGLDVEGLGIVLLEAAALGIPTIATQTGGVPDALVPDATGLLLPTPTSERQQTADLADAITTLLADESLCARFGAAGRAWVRENWSWDISAKTLARLLSADC
jgi:phosphatidylinositol alpha-1,6-mannosyltransferase